MTLFTLAEQNKHYQSTSFSPILPQPKSPNLDHPHQLALGPYFGRY
jgi:hypothetical protein